MAIQPRTKVVPRLLHYPGRGDALGTENSSNSDGFFVLAAWCTVAKAWRDLDDRFESVADARDTAVQARGIYRIAYVRNGKRLDMDPFGFIGDG